MTAKRLSQWWMPLLLQPSRLAKSLSRIVPNSSSQGLTVMVLDGQWLKLLQAEGPANARRITKLLACPVQGASPEELVKTFQNACATEGVQAAYDVLIANPTHLSTVRLFSLPSTDLKEIRDIVELQAEKHTPYAKEEILTDFTVLERDRSGYSRVLLIIGHQDVVHRAVRVIETCGLALDRVGCELDGLVNWFRRVKKDGSAAAPSGSSLVVEVDRNTTTLLVMHRGQLQFHRSLATGSEQLQDNPAQAGAHLVGELQRSVEALEGETGVGKLQEVLLTGCIEHLGEFKALVEQGLGLTVNVLSPWAESELSPAARAACERLPDVSFASLIGLALAPSHLDLTPQTVRLRQAFEAKAKSLVLLACQGVGALILISLLIMGGAQKEHRYYRALQQLYEQRMQEAQQVEEALQQIAFVERRLRQRGELLEATQTLAALSPPEITWESLTFTRGEGVVLKGASQQLPKVYEFIAGLDASPLFGQVEQRRVAKRKTGEGDLTDFEVYCPLASTVGGLR